MMPKNFLLIFLGFIIFLGIMFSGKKKRRGD